jgi:hypothetical protein
MLKPKKVKFHYLLEESYLAFIRNSVGSKSYQSFYVKKGGKKLDVLGKGELSCAFYVSSVLHLFDLIRKPHFTVSRTADDIIRNGGKKVSLSKAKPGDILVWLPKSSKSGLHNHIGFYLGNNKAVSNSDKQKKITLHDWEFSGKRKVEVAIRPDWKGFDA